MNNLHRKRISEIKLERTFHNQPVEETAGYSNSNNEKRLKLFQMWVFADKLVNRLIAIRDQNEPKQGDEWNDDFCLAVRLLPEAQQFEEECWWDYVQCGTFVQKWKRSKKDDGWNLKGDWLD